MIWSSYVHNLSSGAAISISGVVIWSADTVVASIWSSAQETCCSGAKAWISGADIVRSGDEEGKSVATEDA